MSDEEFRNLNEEITIVIKTLQGESDTFQVKSTDNIGNLINKYKKYKGYESNEMVKLTFLGKALDENKALKDYEIQDQDFLHVIVRLHGGF